MLTCPIDHVILCPFELQVFSYRSNVYRTWNILWCIRHNKSSILWTGLAVNHDSFYIWKPSHTRDSDRNFEVTMVLLPWKPLTEKFYTIWWVGSIGLVHVGSVSRVAFLEVRDMNSISYFYISHVNPCEYIHTWYTRYSQKYWPSRITTF